MSISALLVATRNIIRSEMDLESNMCRIMPGAKPPPACGQRFFSIFAADWLAGDVDTNYGISESYSIAVSITFRAGYSPYDDHGEELYIKDLESMENYIRNLLVLLDKSIPVMQAANLLIPGNSVYKIFEPYRFQSADAVPQYVDGSWFQAQPTNNPDPFCGLVQQITFTGARRKQPIGSAS